MAAKIAKPARKRPQDRKAPATRPPRKRPSRSSNRPTRVMPKGGASDDDVQADYEIVDDAAGLTRIPREDASPRAQRITDIERETMRLEAEAKALTDAAVVEQLNNDGHYQTVTDSRAKPCPFCGKAPHVHILHVAPTTAKRIACGNKECPAYPGVNGDTTLKALERWNMRRTGLDGMAYAAGELAKVIGIATESIEAGDPVRIATSGHVSRSR